MRGTREYTRQPRGRPRGTHIPKARQLCGVFVPQGNRFCECRVVKWRRCAFHVAALRTDSLYDSLLYCSTEERNRRLDALDKIQKRRPSWEYKPPEEQL